jgi:hypothetical protein
MCSEAGKLREKKFTVCRYNAHQLKSALQNHNWGEQAIS